MNSLCWNCHEIIRDTVEQCPLCCATSPIYNVAAFKQAIREAGDPSLIRHNFCAVDDSFSHEFGKETIINHVCSRCGADRDEFLNTEWV